MKTLKDFFKKIPSYILDGGKWCINKIISGVKWLWKHYPEVYSIPVAFILYWFSTIAIRAIDPTSAIFDGGVLQIPLFAILLSFLFLSVSWITMGILFGTARKFLKNNLKDAFNKLDSWQKIKYSTGIFFILFLSLALLSFILA